MAIDPVTGALIQTGVGTGAGIASLFGPSEDPLRGLDDFLKNPAFPPEIKRRLLQQVLPRFDVLQNLIFGQAALPPRTPGEEFISQQLGGQLGIPQQPQGQIPGGEGGLPGVTGLPPGVDVTSPISRLLQQQQQIPEAFAGTGLEPEQARNLQALRRDILESGFSSAQGAGIPEIANVLSGGGTLGGGFQPRVEQLISQGIDPGLITQFFTGGAESLPRGASPGGGLQQPGLSDFARQQRFQQGGSHTPEHRAQQAAAAGAPTGGVTGGFATQLLGGGGQAALPPSQFGPRPTAPRRPGLPGVPQQPQPLAGQPRPDLLGAISGQALGRLQGPAAAQAPQLPELPDFGEFLQQRLGTLGRAIEGRAVSRGLSPAGGVAQQLFAEQAGRATRELIPQEAQFGLQRAALGGRFGQFQQQFGEQQRQADIANLFRSLGVERGRRGEFLGLEALGRQRQQAQPLAALQALLEGQRGLGGLFQQFTVSPTGPTTPQPSQLQQALGQFGGTLTAEGLRRLFNPQQPPPPPPGVSGFFPG